VGLGCEEAGRRAKASDGKIHEASAWDQVSRSPKARDDPWVSTMPVWLSLHGIVAESSKLTISRVQLGVADNWKGFL